MEKIKLKIEKLLRLSMSNSPKEAELAALRAVELMEKYSLPRADLESNTIVSHTVEVNYYRIPWWLTKLYRNIGEINGCYVVWSNGLELFNQKGKIVIVGLQSDIQNIEYYVTVFQKELECKINYFKQTHSRERADLKNYRIGLVDGIYNNLFNASKTFNANVKHNALILSDRRYEEAKEHYLSHTKVKMVSDACVDKKYYTLGIKDAQNIKVQRPIHNENMKIVVIENLA